MRIEEEKDSHRLKTQNEMARLKSAAERSQQDAELLQSKYNLLDKKLEETNGRIMELERLLADEKVQKAELTLQAAHYQKAINDKEAQIRSLKIQPKNLTRQPKTQKKK